MKHIEADIAAAEKELDDDAESIITNERYVYIAQVIKSCYRKHNAGSLSTSDKIDRVVTNRWLGLPIFALIMFAVYWIAMVAVGTPATDWANDGLFGDGYHLFGRGTSEYEEAAERYGDTDQIIGAFAEKYGVEIDEENPEESLNALLTAVPEDASVTYITQDEETLETEEHPDTGKAELKAAIEEYLSTEEGYKSDVGAPDPAAYGTWVPGIPVLVERGLDSIGAADWLKGLILDGIVAGVGAVLGFVPQMLVLFLLLAFLEACGYMARIAFVLDRIFRKFGLSGKSFIPMLIGVGCGVPGIMASRTIENERDRRMTIMTTTFIPCSAKVPFISMIAGAIFHKSAWVATSAYFIGMAAIIVSGIILKKTRRFAGRARSLRHGAARLSLADGRQCAPLHVGARLELHQEGRHHHPAVHHPGLVPEPLRRGGRHVPDAGGGRTGAVHPGRIRRTHRLDLPAPGVRYLAGDCRFHHRPDRQGEHRGHHGHPVRRHGNLCQPGKDLHRNFRLCLPGV